MPRVAALCGSFRKGSFNQKLLDNLIARAPEGLEIVQVDITGFPFFSQDLEADFPAAVTEAKAAIAASDCLLLVSPEYDHGVPGYLKNAIDWLSRPSGDATLTGLPMALAGASSGYYGTIRAQLQWRQLWYFFKAPMFSDAELTVPFAAKAFAEDGTIADERTSQSVDKFLAALNAWLLRSCTSVR
jgi:chromate reductase